MVKVTSLLIKAGSGIWFSFGIRAWTEIEIWYIKGMFMLKVVSSVIKNRFKCHVHNFIHLQVSTGSTASIPGPALVLAVKAQLY